MVGLCKLCRVVVVQAGWPGLSPDSVSDGSGGSGTKPGQGWVAVGTFWGPRTQPGRRRSTTPPRQLARLSWPAKLYTKGRRGEGLGEGPRPRHSYLRMEATCPDLLCLSLLVRGGRFPRVHPIPGGWGGWPSPGSELDVSLMWASIMKWHRMTSHIHSHEERCPKES